MTHLEYVKRRDEMLYQFAETFPTYYPAQVVAIERAAKELDALFLEVVGDKDLDYEYGQELQDGLRNIRQVITGE